MKEWFYKCKKCGKGYRHGKKKCPECKCIEAFKVAGNMHSYNIRWDEERLATFFDPEPGPIREKIPRR